MTVLEIMERAGMKETSVAIAWIKDAIEDIQSHHKENLKVDKQNVIQNERDYILPRDLIAIKSISLLDTNDDNKYKSIRRLSGDNPISEDTNP
jgi:hypothetical protein|tara:strand:+ start:45 stop:323 length:279 start_codon:yes stop_codon:yes gene_type:complete